MSKKCFTLVELIIVIAIIGILSVSGVLIITKWISKSKDARRMSDMNMIDQSLQIYMTQKSSLPMPDNQVMIYYSGEDTIIGYQGIYGQKVNSEIGVISKQPKDPKDDDGYVYYIDKDRKKYQLMGYIEEINKGGVNAVDYSARGVITKGKELGIIVDENNQSINQLGITGLNVQTTTNNYKAYFNETDFLQGTGKTLQWLYTNILNGGNGYNEPKSCPEGFIPVAGKKEFDQPGFCVAKYEMKQIDGTAGNGWHNGTARQWNSSSTEICGLNNRCIKSSAEPGLATGTLDGKIISKADGMPIVFLNQATAIRACKAMGDGYHLITNKERMSIARNIEQQGINWTSGSVGDGGIYRGKNYWYTTDYSLNKVADNLDCKGGMTYTGANDYRSLVLDGNSTICRLENGRDKRELFLSNGQIIWDLAGNVWEHVNKGDSINGSGYDVGKLKVDENQNNWNIRNLGLSNEYYSSHKVGWNASSIPQDFRSKYGPSNSLYNHLIHGVGNIYGYYTNDTNYPTNIFLRGSSGEGSIHSGVFGIYLGRKHNDLFSNVGFRCAR